MPAPLRAQPQLTRSPWPGWVPLLSRAVCWNGRVRPGRRGRSPVAGGGSLSYGRPHTVERLAQGSGGVRSSLSEGATGLLVRTAALALLGL